MERLADRVMAAAAPGDPLTVDLETGAIQLPGGEAIAFSVDEHHRRSLLLGLDEVDGILTEDAGDIARFESRQRAAAPWLYLDRAQLAYFDDIEPEKSREGSGHDRHPISLGAVGDRHARGRPISADMDAECGDVVSAAGVSSCLSQKEATA